MAADEREKREYYRIRDLVELCWEPARLEEPTNTERQAQLSELNGHLSDLINVAYRETPILAEAMGLLNRKIDLLTGEDGDGAPLSRSGQVVLSGAGLGFAWESAIGSDDLIDITMRLQPSNLEVTLRTRVLDCKKNQDRKGGYWIRGKFISAQDSAVEQILRHVAFRQTQRLAAEKSTENDD